MASVQDFTGSDGILRSLLTKNVNGRPIPLYPRTSAEVVLYGETSVKMKLDNISNLLGSLSTTVSTVNKTLTVLNANTYNKAYIDSLINGINVSITGINLDINEIRTNISNINAYTKPQVDTLLSTMNTSINNNLNTLTSRVTQLQDYLLTNYYTKAEMDTKLNGLDYSLTQLRNTVNNDLRNELSQFNVTVMELVEERLEDYYEKSYIDSLESDVKSGIVTNSQKIETLREETTSMNAQSISDINEHTDAIEASIIRSNNEKIDTLESNVNAKIESQSEAYDAKFENLHGIIGQLSSSFTTQLNNMYANLVSKIDDSGDDEPAVTYESADEEAY